MCDLNVMLFIIFFYKTTPLTKFDIRPKLKITTTVYEEQMVRE